LEGLLGQTNDLAFVLTQLTGPKIQLKFFEAEYALARLQFRHGTLRGFRGL